MREELLLDVPHRQVVFTIPKMLRLFFRFRRSLLSSLCLAVVQALLKYFKTVSDHELMPGVVAVIQTISDPAMLPFLWWPDENHRPTSSSASRLHDHLPLKSFSRNS